MKNFLQLAVILGLGWLSMKTLPWWTMAAVGALAAFVFHRNRRSSFLIGLLGGAVLWLAPAWMSVKATGGLLAQKIGVLFGGLSVNQLLLVTAIIGGLVTALGAWTGSAARYLFQK